MAGGDGAAANFSVTFLSKVALNGLVNQVPPLLAVLAGLFFRNKNLPAKTIISTKHILEAHEFFLEARSSSSQLKRTVVIKKGLRIITLNILRCSGALSSILNEAASDAKIIESFMSQS